MTLCGYDDSVIVRILCVSDRRYVTPQVVYCVHPGQFSLAVETATSTVTIGKCHDTQPSSLPDVRRVSMKDLRADGEVSEV